MAWLGNTLVALALSIGLSIPNTIYYVAPPIPVELAVELTIEQKILADLPPIFLEIANEESRMRVDAYNPEAHLGCQGSYGILQIACIHFEGEPTFDVDTNIKLAKKIYEDSGFEAWGVCVQKIVKCYE